MGLLRDERAHCTRDGDVRGMSAAGTRLRTV